MNDVPVTIKAVSSIVAEDGDSCWGYYDPVTHTIVVERSLPIDSQYLVMRHELVHAALYGKVELTEEQEEKIAWVLAKSGIVKP